MIEGRAVLRGALMGLIVIVPVAVLYALLDRQIDDFQNSGWAPLFALAIVVAYLVAGVGAGRIALAAPLSNGALAGLGALGLWLPLRVLIWAMRDASNHLFTGTDPVFSASRLLGQAVLAVGLGAIGAYVTARKARRTIESGGRAGADPA